MVDKPQQMANVGNTPPASDPVAWKLDNGRYVLYTIPLVLPKDID